MGKVSNRIYFSSILFDSFVENFLLRYLLRSKVEESTCFFLHFSIVFFCDFQKRGNIQKVKLRRWEGNTELESSKMFATCRFLIKMRLSHIPRFVEVEANQWFSIRKRRRRRRIGGIQNDEWTAHAWTSNDWNAWAFVLNSIEFLRELSRNGIMRYESDRKYNSTRTYILTYPHTSTAIRTHTHPHTHNESIA